MEQEYDPAAKEEKWNDYWVDEKTFEYPGANPDTAYAIDTPPPTVSGNLHMGHLYQFTVQDFVARFERMRGKDVFFPFGYDDNGIASERLTESELGIEHQNYSRPEFQKRCRDVCERYEAEFTEKVQELGISIDWDETYRTISPTARRISQYSFIELYEQGREYRQRAPTIWCPECESAISQAEMEGDERGSHFHDIQFEVADGDETFTVATTRPELLPACVAIFVHPEDENQRLVGRNAVTPLFGDEVPILEDDRVDPDTGSGVVMCCTFGDKTDIEWYQAYDLPLRIAVDESGRMTELASEYEGMDAEDAREEIVADLRAAGALLDRRSITHHVNVHERCGTPIEFLVTEQWYVELLDSKEKYLEAGREIDWYPEKMFSRYRHWIEGLEWDWCISRQRSSGIPFPVWYCEDCDEVILADESDLPVDPLADDPPVGECPSCGHGEFVPEDDVFDTWATSSLTPLINAGWDGDEFERPELYPFDLRPQGHDIISFWLFHTIVKCYEHTGEVPFDSVMINGMVLDENSKKMSKSRGNVVEPEVVTTEYPVDAARYWAAGTSIGDDFPYKEQELVAGRKLLQKLWNASKLVDELTPAERLDRPDLEPLDEWLLARLDREIEYVTECFETREFSKVRNRLRSFFWHTFCDDYLEIAKQRLRDRDDEAAAYTLQHAHEQFVKLFAPILSHLTEELWQKWYAEETGIESVHLASWPEPTGVTADLEAGERALELVSALRRYKADNGLALNSELRKVEIFGDVEGYEDDIEHAMHVGDVEVTEDRPEVESVVADVDLDKATLGPEYGSTLGDIQAAVADGDFEITDDGTLSVAGVELPAETFQVEEERRYLGSGDLLEVGEMLVTVER